MPTIFSNSKELLSLHSRLLDQLETRLAQWQTNDAIGDIFEKLAPYLKRYTT